MFDHGRWIKKNVRPVACIENGVTRRGATTCVDRCLGTAYKKRPWLDTLYWFLTFDLFITSA